MKRFLPFVFVLAGLGVAAALIATGPRLEPRPTESLAPLVRVVVAQPRTVHLNARTHGTVMPRTESELVPEVSGRILTLSPAMVSGGFFRKGDELVSIDPLDYEVALEQARAGLARAQSDLANARKAHERQQDLAQKQSTSASQRDDALNRLMVAQATLREARARLSKAGRDLERTRIRAPYDGRVRSERVDIGQFVARGSPIATIYSTDFAEVRLPVHDHELAILDLPLAGSEDQVFPEVRLRAQFAGKAHEWRGTVVRTEGELDPRSRMINVVAEVESPYDQGQGRPPLAVGLFVEAEIAGDTVPGVTVLPRVALRPGDIVYVVDGNEQLEFREVTVLRLVDDVAYISAGLQKGDRVCVSPLETPVPGMVVRGVEETFVEPASGQVSAR